MNSDEDVPVRSHAPRTDETDAGSTMPPVRAGLRHHVITRLSVERSGRLYSPHDWDFEIPALEIYAAR